MLALQGGETTHKWPDLSGEYLKQFALKSWELIVSNWRRPGLGLFAIQTDCLPKSESRLETHGSGGLPR